VTDPGPPSVYKWSGAQKTHLVVLTILSLFTIYEAIKGRFNTARYKVRAIYGSLSKPPASGACVAEDIVQIIMDQELVDFVLTAK